MLSTGATDWADGARCKGFTHLFFPPASERPQARARREAKAAAMCVECPASQHCRAYARLHHEYGYWGAESEEQRHGAGYTLAAPIGVRNRTLTA